MLTKLNKFRIAIHNKMKAFFSTDFRFFLPILTILTWILSIFTLYTFFATIYDCAINNSLTYPSAQNINTFLSGHKQFKDLYGATVALVIAYLAVKQYLHSNTLQTLDFFFEKLVPDANKTIQIFNKNLSSEEKMLLQILIDKYLKNNKPINFTSEELYKKEPELRETLLKLHSNDLEFQKNAVLTLGYFESFSIKVTIGLVNYKLIEKACSKAFCAQVRILYPLISIYRSENDSLYFTTMTHLFNKWNFS